MFIHGKAELVLPMLRENGRFGSLGLFAFLLRPLVHLRCCKVEEKQILSIAADDITQELVAVIVVPAHEVKELCKEQLAADLSGFSLAVAGTPRITILGVLITRQSNHLLGIGIDQELNKLYRRHLFQAGGIKLDLTVFEGYRGFVDVGKELSTNNLISFIAEVAVLNELRSRCRVVGGGFRHYKLLLVKIHL